MTLYQAKDLKPSPLSSPACLELSVSNTDLEGVKLIKPQAIFDDFRGDYVEIYNKRSYHDAGIKTEFVQDDYATSSKHVLRGIHGDAKTAKLIKCIYGSIYFVVVNNNESSHQYKQWKSFSINDKNRLQVFVPEQFGIAYLVMSEMAVFHYKQSSYYGDAKQFTIPWNDPELKIWWPITNPITSLRDFFKYE